MITGDLIRVKNMVDDWMRLGRSIERDTERLTAEERAQVIEYVRATAAQIQYLVSLLTEADGQPTPRN